MVTDPKQRLAEIKTRLAELKDERAALVEEREQLRATLGREPRPARRRQEAAED